MKPNDTIYYLPSSSILNDKLYCLTQLKTLPLQRSTTCMAVEHFGILKKKQMAVGS